MAIALKREKSSPSGIPLWVYGMMLLGAFLEIARWVVFDGKATSPEADVLVGMLARVFFCAAVVLAVNAVARGQSLRITLTIGAPASPAGTRPRKARSFARFCPECCRWRAIFAPSWASSMYSRSCTWRDGQRKRVARILFGRRRNGARFYKK